MPTHPCPNTGENERTCACRAADCERHGVCCECLRFHLADGSLPMCVRDAVAKAK